MEPIAIDGDFRDWNGSHLLAIDYFFNDTYRLAQPYNDSRDLAAAYLAVGPTGIYLRADLHDLAYQAEEGHLDLYFLLDVAGDGQEWLPDYTDCRTDSPWELAIALYDSDNHEVYDSDFSSQKANASLEAAYNSGWDAVELSFDSSLLTAAGWDCNPASLNVQVFTTHDGTEGGAGEIADKPDLVDALPQQYPWEQLESDNTGWLNGTLGLGHDQNIVRVTFLHHGNQFLKNVGDFVEDDDSMGFVQVPRIHAHWDAPVSLHISGTLAEGIQWHKPEFNAEMRDLVEAGVAHMVGGYYAEYIPQFFPDEFNNWSLAYGKWYNAYYYNDTSVPVAWVPERVFWDGYEYQVAGAGYSGVVVDTEYGYTGFGGPVGGEHRLWREDNDLNVTFISNRGQGNADHNWQDKIFQPSDSGLNLELRSHLGQLAHTGGPRYALYMDDWEKAAGNVPMWGGPGVVANYNRSIGWLAQRPWLEIVPVEGLFDLPVAGEVDINDCSYFWIDDNFGEGLGDHSYRNWYWSRPPNPAAGTVPYAELSLPGTDRRLGQWDTPGTVIGDTWALISQLPEGNWRDLAYSVWSAGLYETAWWDRVPGEEQSYIPHWQREQAYHSRYAALYYHAWNWTQNGTTGAWAQDVDLDGQAEYLLANEQLFGVWEALGGKLVFLMDQNGTVLVGNHLAGWMEPGDHITDAVTSTTSNHHYDNAGDPGEQAGSFYLEGAHTWAFESLGLENEPFTARVVAGGFSFSHGEQVKNFSLIDEQVVARFQNSGKVRVTATPDMAALRLEGRPQAEPTANGYNWRAGQANLTLLTHGAALTATGHNTLAYYVEVSSPARLTLTAGAPPANRPPSVTPLPDPGIDEDIANDHLLDLWVHFEDESGPGSLTYTVETGSTAYALKVLNGRWLWAAPLEQNWHGLVTAQITATDPGGLSATADFNLTVASVADPPEVLVTQAPAGPQNDSASLAGQITDVDSSPAGVALEGRWKGRNWSAIAPDPAGDWNWSLELGLGDLENGSHTFQLQARDEANVTSAVVEVTIQVLHPAPEPSNGNGNGDPGNGNGNGGDPGNGEPSDQQPDDPSSDAADSADGPLASVWLRVGAVVVLGGLLAGLFVSRRELF